MAKLKGIAVVAFLVFFVAYSPAGATAAISTLGDGFVKFVDGVGAIAVALGGDR